jgi:tRNA threonylcarbamoyladenosine biosynthesis protein TsaB
MKILALDTSTEFCSVAVSVDARVLERVEPGNRHAERILALVDALLAEAGLSLKQLDAVAYGRGPGSFTGLRIGAGVAQGLAFGADRPVVPVSSLAALAQDVTDASHILAALDARMNQVYWGAFRRNARGFMEKAGEECVTSPAEAPMPAGENWVGAGPGWAAYAAELSRRAGARLAATRPGALPTARAIAALANEALPQGRAIRPEGAVPVYLRDNVAEKSGKA